MMLKTILRNITGAPVEGINFFDRPVDIARLERELGNQGNLLLVAPRRVGKTSLVLRLCELERQAGHSAVYLNVESCHDELAFAEKLVDGLREANLEPEILQRVTLGFHRLRRAASGMGIGGAGVDVEMGTAEDPDLGTLGKALDSIFRKIETTGTKVLLVIDELPELLLSMAKQEHGKERVTRLLHWLRALRQEHRQQVRWVFLGSIGLDSFVDERNLAKTINDLTPMHLEALTEAEADEFLERLGLGGPPLAPAQRKHMIRLIGWPLPFHLQIFFHAVVDGGVVPVDEAAVDEAFERLLGPAHRSHFDTWRQRLDEQFAPADATLAKDILRYLCQHLTGRTREQILDALMTTRLTEDARVVEERLARLLQMLLRDGYLLEAAGVYAFRSFLLREYWHRREVL